MEKRLYSHEDKRIALERQDGLCGGGCGEDLWNAPMNKAEGHHLLPWAMGGSTDIDNLVVMCKTCHQYHDIQAICGVMYGGYEIWDMEESQIRDPYLTLHSIPLTKENQLNPNIQEHKEILKKKVERKIQQQGTVNLKNGKGIILSSNR